MASPNGSPKMGHLSKVALSFVNSGWVGMGRGRNCRHPLRTRGTSTGATDLLNDHNPKEHPPLIRNSNVTTCASEVPPRSFISGGIVVAFITVVLAVTERNSCAEYSIFDRGCYGVKTASRETAK